MKIDTQFNDQLIQYEIPLRLGAKKISDNIFSKLTLNQKKAIDLYSLEGFYQNTLAEKKNAITNFFLKNDIKLEHLQLNKTFLNASDCKKIYEPEILFDIECAIFSLANYSFNEKNKINSNFFYDNITIPTSGTLKIKVAPNKEKLSDLASQLNLQQTLPLIRLDGNRQFELFELVGFLKLLNPNVLDKIEYIEEPFKNFYDLYTFKKYFNIKIAIDESLINFQNDLEKLPNNSPLVLKPALYGISRSYQLIENAYKLNHYVIISSTYQPASTMLPLIFLAEFSNNLAKKNLYHGLDTFKFLPKSYQNAPILSAFSLY